MIETTKKPLYEVMFAGLHSDNAAPRFPHFMHKENAVPILVNNDDEELEARANGYDNITAAAISNRYLINWFWDLEDFSPRQLTVFAKEEFGVELPVEAGQEKLFQAICELVRYAPQNQNRLILMAHTISMNYDATIEEIKRMMIPGINGVCNEVITFEVVV